MPSSSFRHFERSREIFLAHRLSCRMTLLVCLFSMRSHTHHFPSCHEDPSASLGMTRGKMPSRCCREDRSGGWCLFEALYPLPLARPFSCDRRAAVASAVGHPHGGDRRSGWRYLALRRQKHPALSLDGRCGVLLLCLKEAIKIYILLLP